MMGMIVRRGGREWHPQKGGHDERERGGYESFGRRHVLNYLVNSNLCLRCRGGLRARRSVACHVSGVGSGWG